MNEFYFRVLSSCIADSLKTKIHDVFCCHWCRVRQIRYAACVLRSYHGGDAGWNKGNIGKVYPDRSKGTVVVPLISGSLKIQIYGLPVISVFAWYKKMKWRSAWTGLLLKKYFLCRRKRKKKVYQKHTKVLVESISVLLAVCHTWFITSDLVTLVQIPVYHYSSMKSSVKYVIGFMAIL